MKIFRPAVGDARVWMPFLLVASACSGAGEAEQWRSLEAALRRMETAAERVEAAALRAESAAGRAEESARRAEAALEGALGK